MKIINSGIATGYVYNFRKTECIYGQKATNIQEEKELFLNSIDSCLKALMLVEEKTSGTIKDIINTYIVFLTDQSVKKEVLQRIDDFEETAGCAYSTVMDRYVRELSQVEDDYLKERAKDFLDIKEKVLKEMYQQKDLLKIDRATILVVDELQTSLVLNLPKNVVGIIAQKGGNLSHAAILVKERNIPFVIDKNIKLKCGAIITLNTDQRKIKQNKAFKEIKTNNKINFDGLIKTSSAKACLYLNISTMEELNNPTNKFYEGVGLVRSELLFSKDNIYPSLERQVNHYKKILGSFYPKEVKIRMFDIKEDKGLYFFINHNVDEFNFNGSFQKVYLEQLKAMLLANEPYGNLNVIIPMIKDVCEYQVVKDNLKALKEELDLIRETPKLGIMLETKAALNNISDFQEVDFINVGTNDLIKDLYKIDREQLANSEKYTQKIIKELKNVKIFSLENNIPCFYCGDLVSTKSGLLKLLHKGEKRFSIADGFFEEAVETINDFD